MQKTYLKLSLLAVLVAGATMAISCSKESEDAVSDNISTLKAKAVDQETIVSTVNFSWLHYYEFKDALGNVQFQEVCLKEHSKIICSLSPQTIITTENSVILTSLVEDGIIRRLYLAKKTMPKELDDVFRKYVEKGTVKFVEDCPIEDSKLREILKKDYIPAGEYPIYLEENDYVILLSK